MFQASFRRLWYLQLRPLNCWCLYRVNKAEFSCELILATAIDGDTFVFFEDGWRASSTRTTSLSLSLCSRGVSQLRPSHV